MKKVISFSLYKAPSEWEKSMDTNYKKYILGLEQNLPLIKKYYPDWHIYVYHNEHLDQLELTNFYDYSNFEYKLITDKSINAMQWRFLPNDEKDVDFFICRDVDSRITERETKSVNEWIDSGKALHIMRDHPHHNYKILGGMWGMRKQNDFDMKTECINYNIQNGYKSDKDWYDKWWDMNFLRDVIYPKYSKDSYINASHHRLESWAKPFTIDYNDKKFVGEIYDENNERQYHYKLI